MKEKCNDFAINQQPTFNKQQGKSDTISPNNFVRSCCPPFQNNLVHVNNSSTPVAH